jgi:hypothetical protein
MESLHWVDATELLAATQRGRPGALLTARDADGDELRVGRFLGEVLRQPEFREHLARLAASGGAATSAVAAAGAGAAADPAGHPLQAGEGQGMHVGVE